ncbi:MAG: hypothetical protein COW73_08660 [Nitrospirae bacterium CG18_big_fil_WC_8_21_14_2_50_70_55]|nr:MAG: hypothetical protein AUK30_11470 [Nitrospirae bacterium CG2_30_70_394]PIQ04184.1 MAG: hypothetical protein COW73_08660 [Nitrospirae bacterium CG18_big_fil_WC_8_21_14_2_50_70_55]PIU79792.1 MAG: hypothetical protein COS73_02675 [Nitrospirae bacterium CG06_land_8_20_14_3_00_70_43]PIX83859.1 MAG: hypothetical protein COZ33_03150 [Nitrospirae bacterium CG_4_10_14_3_um_filter_70_108]
MVCFRGLLEKKKSMRNLANKMALAALPVAVWMVAVAAAAAPPFPRIDAGFSAGGTPHEQILHVEADFGAIGPGLCRVLCDLASYPALHPWITESYPLSVDPVNGTQDVFVTLNLPWPAGQQWARLEVERFGGHTLAWRQVEGSFAKLNGTLIVQGQGDHVRLSYWAVIDVGLPNVATQPVIEHFAREFLRAAYNQAAQPGMQGNRVAPSSVRVAVRD